MSAFDRSDRFQQELPEILTAIAAPRVPDYVDDLLAQAAATRQRPRWTFLERWLPMGAIAQRAYFPSVPWRPIVALALLILALVAAVLVAGSQTRVPPPFGPARNGALAFGDGDVYVRDGVNGASSLVLGGPTDDFAAAFTRDGTRLLFLRRTAGEPGTTSERIQMYAANRDGSDAVAVSEPLIAPDWWDIAPDDASIVVAAGPPHAQRLYIADLRSPGDLRAFQVGDPPMITNIPNYLGPTGAEIVFRGRTVTESGVRTGIFAVRSDGSGLRQITPTDGHIDNGYQHPQPSPDGHYITYTDWDAAARALRIHLVDLRTGADRIIMGAGPTSGYATFSPDSTRLVFVRYGETTNQVMVLPVDGHGPPLAMGPEYKLVEGQFISGVFSPDGKSVIVNDPASRETRLIDAVTGGEGTVLPWGAGGFSGWQRLAP